MAGTRKSQQCQAHAQALEIAEIN